VYVCVCGCVCQYKLLHSNKLSQLSNFVSSPRVHCVAILYSRYETSTINIVMKSLNYNIFQFTVAKCISTRL